LARGLLVFKCLSLTAEQGVKDSDGKAF
jgi:hypothetical protein